MKHLSRSTRNPRVMSIIKYIFTPNYERYEGVRPINIYFLRVLYFLDVCWRGPGNVEDAPHSSRSVGSYEGRGVLRLGRIPDAWSPWSDKAAPVAADRDLHDLL